MRSKQYIKFSNTRGGQSFERRSDRNDRNDRNDRGDKSNITRDRSNTQRSVNKFNDNGQQVCYRLDVGQMHGVKPGNIVGAIANEGGISSRHITGIRINADHSIVYLPHGISKEVLSGLNKSWVCGRQLKLAPI